MVSSFVNPRQILAERLQLKRNMLAADFGCGSGEWAAALAEVLVNGKVYAIDLLDESLSAVRSKARIKNLENIEIVKGDVEKLVSRLLANSLDVVLMSNLLFQAGDKKAIFAEAFRVLKTGGKVLAVDWNKNAKNAAIGPADKISPQEVKDIARAAGFALASEFEAGSFHFGMVFEKK
ncbi:MAG: class I SAM-dependent methyltransferase [Candidatus Nealsonbacteria bacterium DGGOD1a]|nr:MAG: class I SAM-dependent methyltransferase [Candidatus Nealsonbacteria bacterium DGGOD1a]